MKLDEMEALEKEASEAPWVHAHYALHEVVRTPDQDLNIGSWKDASFIAASREWVPWAIARMQKLEAIAEEAKRLRASRLNKDSRTHMDELLEELGKE